MDLELELTSAWLNFRHWLARLFGRRSDQRPHMVPAQGPAHIVPVSRPKPVSVNEVFTPTRPRSGRRTLVGREAELARILDAVLEESAHVVLYSERGRGKTSLSNLAVESLRRRGAIVARCACDADSSFDSMIRALARDLPRSVLAVQPAREDADGCEGVLPERPLGPADVAALPRSLTCPLVVFAVDEFDRVIEREARTKLADTVKMLSDRGEKLFFMIVGVSDTLEQIIGQHPSIQRNIVSIHLPLLRDDEIAAMLTKGGQQAGVRFTPDAVRVVTRVARGMPFMAQLLGLRVTQAALRRGDEAVAREDLLQAVLRLIDDATSTVLNSYAALLAAEPGMADLLGRLADAPQDGLGRLAASRNGGDVVVGGVRMSPDTWSRLVQAGVFSQQEFEAAHTQFADRPLIYYVQLLAAKAELAPPSGAAAELPRLRTVNSNG